MKRSPSPARRKPLRSKPKPAVPRDVRTALRARSGGRCEAELEGCLGTATDAHHRISRKMGGGPGDHDRLSNLLHLCRACHSWITARPGSACVMGLSLKGWQDPAGEPAMHRGVQSYLDDLGQVLLITKDVA